jgi:predicted outer membrane repeat protein
MIALQRWRLDRVSACLHGLHHNRHYLIGINMATLRSRFIRNYATITGNAIGIVIGAANVTDCIFIANKANLGGAIQAYENTIANVTGCTFADNVAGDSGGGFYGFINSTAIITDSTFLNNSGHTGGALYTKGNLTVATCTFDRQLLLLLVVLLMVLKAVMLLCMTLHSVMA